MYVNPEVIQSATALVQGALDNGMPVKEEAEWKGFDEDDTKALHVVLDELSFADLQGAVEAAAKRASLPTDADEDETGEDD